MANPIISLFKFLFTSDQLEDRLLRVSCLIISILIIPAMVLNQLSGAPLLLNGIMAVMFVFYMGTFIYTIRRPITNVIQLAFLYTTLIALIPMWFLNGGMLGSMPPILILFFLLGSYIRGSRGQARLVVIYFLGLIALYVLEYSFPGLVVTQEDETTKKLIVSSGMIMASIAIAIIVVSFRLNYLKERNKLLNIQNQLRRTNNELREAKNQSESANRTKSVFLANMSHEIRTPLNSIIGAIDLIKGSGMSREQQDLIQLMDESSANLLQLLTDILDLSKIEAKKILIRSSPVDLNTLIVNMVSFGRNMIIKSGKGLNLNGQLADGLSQYVRSDNTRLTQVLSNLISNAIKYSESGNITIELSKQEANGRPYLVFEVADEGVGISPEHIQSIYEPFTQVDDRNEFHVQGVGLGLAITKSIVELMDGKLEVESKLNEGSTFRVILPYEPCEAPASTEASGKDYRGRFSGYTFLLVEDNRINQVIITKMVSELGARTIVADDGFAALKELSQGRFDAVLMDLNMPGIDGIETTTRLRKLPGLEHQVVIAVTANVLAQDEQRCIDAGLDGYLSKPLTISGLGAKLAEVLGPSKIELASKN